jgi:deoxyribonuclease V
MEILKLHDWPENSDDAIRIQLRLKDRIIIENGFNKLEYLTAIDTAFDVASGNLFAAAVTLRLPGLTDVERSFASMKASFPHIPDLLSFREGPVILTALSRLLINPDIVIFASHGIAHPRSFGLASHLGLLTDTPSIGCARKHLCGDYRLPSSEKGSCSSLFVANIESGFAYRTKEKVKPMFISPGHKCSIHDSLEVIRLCLTDYRMPEPLRMAHLYAVKYRQTAEKRKNLETVGIGVLSENSIDD